MTEQERLERREARKAERKRAKAAAILEAERKQPKPYRIEIGIEWSKSRTWGNCPTLTARIHYETKEKGFYCDTFTSHASGYGYEKESSVLADLFNHCLKGALYAVKKWEGHPYGVREYETEQGARRYFEGGVGVSCYLSSPYRDGIDDFIGGHLEQTASGQHFTAYLFTMKRRARRGNK